MGDLHSLGATTQRAATGVGAVAPAKQGGSLFHEILSDLNPLQYIPVVGTIYRAITGDEGNASMRFAASLGTSFLLGGPIGIAVTAGEKLAGIDPERMVLDAARTLFHLGHAEAGATATIAGASGGGGGGSPQPAVSVLAFAVDSRGMDADTLNGLELQRLRA